MRRTKYPKHQSFNFNAAPIREAQFVHEYMVDLDPEQAALRAGIVTELTPKQDRQRQIKNVMARVRDQLYGAIHDRAARLGITGDKAILEIANIAFSDPCNLFDDSGELKSLGDLPQAVRKTVSEIDFAKSKDGSVYPRKIKMYDKMQALQTLLKQQGDLGPDVQVNQYNQTNNYTQNNYNVDISLDDFSEQELQVMRKMIGDEDPEEVLDLQRIEQQHA